MQVCFTRDPPYPPVLKIDGREPEVVTETKIVGLTVQSNLCWNIQVDSIVGIEQSLSVHAEPFEKVWTSRRRHCLCVTFICSSRVEYATHGQFGMVVFTEKQFKKLESIQKRSCRIILGAKYNSKTEALDLTELQTLSNRHIQLCTKFAVDCIRSDRYSEWFPLNNKIHGMTLRRSRTYQTLRSRTLRYGKSPLPYLCDLLNNHE